METVLSQELPALFRAADRGSLAAQRRYLRLVRADLILIVVGALATSWAASSGQLRTALAVGGAVALTGGFALTALVLQAKPDKSWFGARALAESVKTISWRYMAGAEPYVLTLAERDVDALFSNELEALLRERSAIGPVLGGADATSEQVTQTMRRVRAMELDQRMGIYLADRIRNQRQWYGERSEANRKSSTFWLFAVGLSQLAGATAAIAMVRWPSAQFNAAAVCSSIAAAVMAWLQVKRHQELAHSYGLAAHELGLIEARARHVSTNEEFSAFVADAENAISREHTMWVARREVIG